MLSLEAAVGKILADVTPLAPEKINSANARGRWLAREVLSPTSLPAFDNSAMDGYAVRAADTATASSEHPVRLRCVGETPAGRPPGRALLAGECGRVFTGSPVPPGADAVVMQEDVKVDPASPDEIQVLDAARPWDNVRFCGEDIKAGARLADAGTRINFALLAVLGAAGCDQIEVTRKPKVALLATGDELVEPGTSLEPGQVFESNRAMLRALVEETGCSAVIQPVIRDKLDATKAALQSAFARSDVVISSGGVSVGAHDHVKPAFAGLGGQLDLWKVAIRPGKPFAYGRLNSQLFFGLPGNPVSAAVTFLLLVRPALIRLQAGRQISLERFRAGLSVPVANPGARRHFVRVRFDESGKVEPVGSQGSHVLSGLAGARGLLDMPPGSAWEAGHDVEVLLFP